MTQAQPTEPLVFFYILYLKYILNFILIYIFQNSIGYDAYCYGIKDETADWNTAENICAEAPYGHLATINDR